MSRALARPLSPPAAWSTIDSEWPREEPGFFGGSSEEPDDDAPLELDLDDWVSLVPDDDYEPEPEPGDFWGAPDGE